MNAIFIDANIYLRFFDSNQKNFRKLLDQLLKIENYIFITNQIANEVERNKLSVFEKSIGNYNNKIKIEKVTLPEHFADDSYKHDIVKWNERRKKLEADNIKLIKELDEIITESVNKISSSNDVVSLKLEKIFKNAIKETDEDIINARKRKESGNPPGKNNDPLGDQITWEQLLKKVDNYNDVWIISNDYDYFTVYGKKCYLNSFLFNELIQKNPSIKIKCYNLLADGLKSFFEQIEETSFIDKKSLEKIREEEILAKTTVQSSNISSIGYNSQTSILEIEFLNGSTYHYFDVPRNVYEELLSADSHGKYFAHSIKGSFRYSKV